MSVLSEGRELGSVSLQRTFFTPTIKVADQAGNTVYTLVSQTCQCSCGDDIDYRILDPNRVIAAHHSNQTDTTSCSIDLQGEEIGTITKQYNGCCKEIFTDADNFGINFPVGADTNQKEEFSITEIDERIFYNLINLIRSNFLKLYYLNPC